MAIETVPFNPDKYFESAEAQIHLINDALASGDPGYIADAISIIARRHGIDDIGAVLGYSRSGAWRSNWGAIEGFLVDG